MRKLGLVAVRERRSRVAVFDRFSVAARREMHKEGGEGGEGN